MKLYFWFNQELKIQYSESRIKAPKLRMNIQYTVSECLQNIFIKHYKLINLVIKNSF